MTEPTTPALCFYQRICAQPADSSALVELSGKETSYGQLTDFVAEKAAEIKAFFGEGNARLLLLLEDQPHTMVLQLCLLDSCTFIPANPKLSIAELVALAKRSGANSVVAVQGNTMASQLAADCELAEITLVPRDDSRCGLFDLQWPERLPEPLPRSADVALLLSTSGSTGDPKLVPLGRQAVMDSAQNIANWLELGADDRALHILPMFHIGALVDLFLAPLLSGGSVCFAHPMSSDRVASAVLRLKVSWIQLVPTMLLRLLKDLPEVELQQMGKALRFIRSVSSGLPQELQQLAEAKFADTPLIQIYGMTESAGQIASNPLPPKLRKPGSVGLAAGSEIAIMDNFGNPLDVGTEGEICIKGNKVMAGYEGMDSGASFYGAWLRTGDLGWLDGDGYLFISGRLKEMVNRGGEKISLSEIDQVALQIPGVEQAAAFAIPHESLGEEVAIALVPELEGGLDKAGLKQAFASQLADYKVPRKIHILSAMPLLASGKINRRALPKLTGDSAAKGQEVFRPGSITERLVYRLWRRILKKRVTSAEDDFFDAGGDSLAAAEFLAALEKALGITVPSDFLYKHPSFQAMVNNLHEQAEGSYDLQLAKPIFDAVRRATAAWPGKRRSANSLIIEHNSAGRKQAFFWSGNGLEHFEDMLSEMGSDRPFYLLRTLSGLKQKSGENTRLLAAHYALEIEEIQPEGAICIGGFCQGAVLAREVASILADRGREIKFCLFVDRVFVQPFDLPSLLVWSRSSQYSARTLYENPGRGLPSLYPAGAEAIYLDSMHRGSVFGEGATKLVEILCPYLDGERRIPAWPEEEKTSFEERKALYRAQITAPVPRLMHKAAKQMVEAEITNTSAQPWPASDQSGLVLAARWINLDGHVRTAKAGAVGWSQEIAPGESLKLQLELETPGKFLLYLLLLDILDDGISWFHQQGGQPYKKLVVCR